MSWPPRGGGGVGNDQAPPGRHPHGPPAGGLVDRRSLIRRQETQGNANRCGTGDGTQRWRYIAAGVAANAWKPRLAGPEVGELPDAPRPLAAFPGSYEVGGDADHLSWRRTAADYPAGHLGAASI